ncbi:hypothetical protein WS1363 [Wolinella succinogenes]|uniref:Uncharacterized protein n=1 Tax=Wolinella succinogenes (strain ATCC 29543 / DSM 1740 / CCUG 13145 / JCM 31913 / LMG 7466 / NCTC 11488 / FDC 602W) TaxID=273121 RepID=Q7MRH0_WOLSU|nr:hypothetical protein WS1363 [Wolinella succinogenes]HCZ19730.1 hypothetical protein [Helicobacter sp.]
MRGENKKLESGVLIFRGIILDTLKKKCLSYCEICEINPNDKDGKFIGYSKIKSRSSNKKNSLNGKLKEMGE